MSRSLLRSASAGYSPSVGQLSLALRMVSADRLTFVARTAFVVCFLIFSLGITAQPSDFRHPGLVITDESLERMQHYLEAGTEPVVASFNALCADKRAQATYKMAGPYAIIARDGTFARTKGGSESDFSAAFYNALLWRLLGENGLVLGDVEVPKGKGAVSTRKDAISKDDKTTGNKTLDGKAHRDKALEIIRAYNDSLQGVDGHDAPLCCLQGYYLVNAMELLRSNMTAAEMQQCRDMLQRVFVPVIDRFEAMSPYANGNWGAIVNKMRMAVAIFTDNSEMYAKACGMFLDCNDNAALPHYIAASGQCQETGRDQGHAQLGVGNLAEQCEMAWNQGDDLWAALDDRVMVGYEYMARYNLGYDVPFTTWTDCTGLYCSWTEPGAMNRGKFPDIYELPYAHYVGRRHLAMPYTAMVLGRSGGVRPETKTGNCDAIGLGSLLFYNGAAVNTKSKSPSVSSYTKLHAVYTAPAPDGAPLKHDYDVYIQPRGQKEWTKIDTYMAKVNAYDPAVVSTKHRISEISYAQFDFTGDVFVRVVCRNKKFTTARIRPDYKGVIANIQNDSILQFMLFQPENVSVEFDGSISDNLLLFTSKPPVSADVAERDAKRQGRRFVLYPAGMYEVDTIRCTSNTTYFLAPGSYFTGTFAVDDAENVSILGRGIARPPKGYEGAHVYRSSHVLIDGLTLCTCPIGESADVTLHDVRSISHPQWGDGLNVFGGCSDILYDRVFCRNSDDCTTAYATRKGFKGSVHNVRMTNSTLWADVAHPIMIGLHGNAEQPDSIVHLVYENIDILGQAENQTDYQGCLAINSGDNNTVSDVIFDNIRIEQITTGALFHIKVCYNDKYGLAPGGNVENIHLRNIRYNGTLPTMSIITGYSDDRQVRNITFEGLKLNGQSIYDDMPTKPRWYHTTDYIPCYLGPHVENVVFKP